MKNMITGQATYAMVISHYIQADSAHIIGESSTYLATSTMNMIFNF